MPIPETPEQRKRRAAERAEAAARNITLAALQAERVLRRAAAGRRSPAELMESRSVFLAEARAGRVSHTTDERARIACEHAWLSHLRDDPALAARWRAGDDDCYERLRALEPGAGVEPGSPPAGPPSPRDGTPQSCQE